MKCSLLIFLTLSCLYSFCQTDYFEGKITYQLTYLDPETGEDITNQYKDLLGSQKVLYIDDANYKYLNQSNELLQLYNAENQTVFVHNSNSGHILEVDSRTSIARVTEVEYLDAGEEVFGKYCNRVIIKTVMDETLYWFDPSFKINKDAFLQHQYEHFSDYLQASNGSLPYKYRYEGSQYVVIGTVTKIEPMELPIETFKLAFPIAAD